MTYRLSFILLLASITVAASGCNTVMKTIFGNKQLISEAVEIGPEWTEITPPSPLSSRYSIQHVALRMPESVWRGADWDETDQTRKTLKYPDGRSGKIEAFLYDEEGTAFELVIGAKTDGIDLARKIAPRKDGDPPRTGPDFPDDRTYTKLKIRSDVALHLDRIEWTGYDPQ